MPRKAELTAKQRAFVREYLKDFCATQAALRAGYAKGSARDTASKLLRHDRVSELLRKEQAKLAERAEVDADRLLQELDMLALSTLADFIETDGSGRPTMRSWDDIDSDAIRTIKQLEVDGGKVKIRQHDKIRPLIEALRRRGELPPAVAVSTEDDDILRRFYKQAQ